MDMSTRIHHAWAKLSDKLESAETPQAFISGLRSWLQDTAANVSANTRGIFNARQSVAGILSADPALVPLPSDAVHELRAYSPSADPARFGEDIARFCWRLLVYRYQDDACEVCQGDLELWTNDGQALTVCDGCDRASDGHGNHWLAPPQDARPATRAEVLRHVPDADIMQAPHASRNS